MRQYLHLFETLSECHGSEARSLRYQTVLSQAQGYYCLPSFIARLIIQVRRHELPAQPASQSPAADNLFLRRGDELFNDGDYQSAVFMYSEALRQDQNNALLYLKSSFARTLSTPPQLDLALQDVNSAIQINPFMGNAWKQKGDIYIRKGDYRAAEEALVQATGMLQGMEKVQAQQSLIESRSRSLPHNSMSPTPTIQAPTELPVRPQVSTQSTNPQTTTTTTLPTRSASTNPQTTTTTTLPTRSTSTNLTPTTSQSSPVHNRSANLSPISPVSPPSLSPSTVGAGIPCT